MWRTRGVCDTRDFRVSASSTSLVFIINSNEPRDIPSPEHLHKYGLSILEENAIIEPEQDMDPYPWLIWYIWKAMNDKLFRGIDRDPFELVRYAESECQAWYNARETIPVPLQVQIAEETQALSLNNICMVDSS